MINKATTLDCLEELKNLGSLITLIAKATPDATLSSDIESCAGLAWDMTNSISRKLSSAMLLQNKNSAINNRLRTQREACGLTTAELARLLDLDEEIIIQWESGEYEPTISMLIPLANILGCDAMWLLTGEVTPRSNQKVRSSNTMTHLNKFAPYLAKLFYGRTNTNGDIIAASPLKVHANIFINHCGNSLNMKTLLRLAI